MSRYNNDGGYISSNTSTSLINNNNVHENNNNVHENNRNNDDEISSPTLTQPPSSPSTVITIPSSIRRHTKVIAKVKTLKENDEWIWM